MIRDGHLERMRDFFLKIISPRSFGAFIFTLDNKLSGTFRFLKQNSLKNEKFFT